MEDKGDSWPEETADRENFALEQWHDPEPSETVEV
jgi:hypothetical protein